MSDIYLIRHGQASFHKKDYDQLSELGMQQSLVLGAFFERHYAPTRMIVGAMRRHRQTLEFFQENCSSNKVVEVEGAFNELDHVDVLQVFDSSWNKPEQNKEHPQKKASTAKDFEKIFIGALDLWQSGTRDADYKENWSAFKSRVVDGFNAIISNISAGEQLVIFTSGGPIAVIVAHILGVDDHTLLKLNQQIINTSITHLKTNGANTSLSAFNHYPHLYEHDLISRR